MISVIPVDPNPYGVAVSADGAYLYVTTDDNRGGGSPGKVWVIRL